MTYNPIASLRGLRKEMQRGISAAGEPILPGTPVEAPFAVLRKADTVCVLLKMLTDDGPVPDDIRGLLTGAALRSHVRADGAVYRGAFETQGAPDSVVLVWADPSVSDERCLLMANMERPALERRYHDWTLGPFAATPPSITLN